jgi:hypothetical protein
MKCFRLPWWIRAPRLIRCIPGLHAESESVRLDRRLIIEATMPLTAAAPSTRRPDRGVFGESAEAQLAAVAAEVETRLFPRPAPLPHTPAELPDLVTAVYRAAEGQLPLLRAMVNSGVGTEVRRRRRAQRLQAIQHALAGIGASEAKTRRGVAVVSMLASADAGLVLADQYGLTLAEAGAACAEATRAIIADLTAQAARDEGERPQR